MNNVTITDLKKIISEDLYKKIKELYQIRKKF